MYPSDAMSANASWTPPKGDGHLELLPGARIGADHGRGPFAQPDGHRRQRDAPSFRESFHEHVPAEAAAPALLVWR